MQNLFEQSSGLSRFFERLAQAAVRIVCTGQEKIQESLRRPQRWAKQGIRRAPEE